MLLFCTIVLAVGTLASGQDLKQRYTQTRQSCLQGIIEVCENCDTIQKCMSQCELLPAIICKGVAFNNVADGGDASSPLCAIMSLSSCGVTPLNPIKEEGPTEYWSRIIVKSKDSGPMKTSTMLPPTASTKPTLKPLNDSTSAFVDIFFYHLPWGTNCQGGDLKVCMTPDCIADGSRSCAKKCLETPLCGGFASSRNICLLKNWQPCRPVRPSTFTYFKRKIRPGGTSKPTERSTIKELPTTTTRATMRTFRPVTYPPETYPPETYPPKTYPPETYPPKTYPPKWPTKWTAPPRTTTQYVDEIPKRPLGPKQQGGVWNSRPDLSSQCQVSTEQKSEGKEFILMFMENYADDPQNYPLELFVTTGSSVEPGTRVNVEVSTPGFPSQDPNFIRPARSVIEAGKVQMIQVSNQIRNRGTSLQKKCIRVTGTENLVVYGVNKETFTADGFLGIAVAGLGLEHYVIQNYPATYNGLIGVAATEDDTELSVRFPRKFQARQGDLRVRWQGRELSWRGEIKIKMNKCDTLQIQSGRSGDLTGTRVAGTKPIAVFSGNSRTNVKPTDEELQSKPHWSWKTRDHLVEQLPPTESWSKNFVTCPSPNRTVGDLFYTIGSKPNTRVTIRGTHQDTKQPWNREFVLQEPGDFKRILIPSGVSTHITSSEGILVVALILSQTHDASKEVADPALIVIPPLEQYDIKYAFSTSKYGGRGRGPYTQNILIQSKTTEKNKILLDGKQIGNHGYKVEWSEITGTEWSCGYTQVQPGSFPHNIRHMLPLGQGAEKFGAILYGAGDRESYSYPVGMKTAKVNIECAKCKMSPCDGADNDCDGKTDEEFCDGTDDDGDGFIDEDCCAAPPTTTTVGPPKCLATDTQRSEGKNFVLMFMENIVADPKMLPLEMYITAGSSVPEGTTISVKVSSPGMRNIQQDQTLTVSPGVVKKVELDHRLKQVGTGIQKKCVRVEGVEDFLVVYGVNKETFTADGFLGISTSGLGNEYMVVSQYPPTYHCEFGIAALEDNTKVTIKFPRRLKNDANGVNNYQLGNLRVQFNGREYTWGSTLEVTMNKCDTLQIQSGKTGDLTGTHIDASSNIAVFSGNARTNVHGEDATKAWKTRDHLVEQMPPLSSWGKKFMLCPIPGRETGDLYIFVAGADNTEISLHAKDLSNGKNEKYHKKWNLEKKGDFARVFIPSKVYGKIESTGAILVVMIVLSQETDDSPDKADPAMILIPPSDQYDFKYAFATSTYAGKGTKGYTQHIIFIAETRYKDQIKLDSTFVSERPKKTSWITIPESEWTCGYTTVADGAHRLQHTAEYRGEFRTFGAILYGAGDRESYAYPVGMKTKSINVLCQKCPNVPCDAADNDCDGQTNEELCDGIDDDGDGLIDEDCCGAPAPPGCKDLRTDRFCFGKEASIQCPAGQSLKIVQSHFGRIGNAGDDTCGGSPFAGTTDVDCGFADMYTTVAPRCDEKDRCSMKVDSLLLGLCGNSGLCQLCAKYLEISYLCVEQPDRTCREMSTIKYVATNDGVFTASSHQNTGLVSGYCPNSAFKEKYQCDGNCGGIRAPDDANLCAPKYAVFASDNTHAWCPEKCDQMNSFIQIDLGNTYDVRGIVTQGCRKFPNWVTTYQVKYSRNGRDFTEISKEMKGNEDSVGVRMCLVNFSARYVRLYVKGWQGHPCMHVEVVRCGEVKL